MMMQSVREAASGDSLPVEQPSYAVEIKAGLAAIATAVLWTSASVALIGGFAFWSGSLEAQVHLALNLGCTLIAATCAFRVHGSLDYKLGQSFLVTFVIFGMYALAILAGRLYFSRFMITSTVLETLTVTILIVALRHRLAQHRVAIITPLIGEGRVALPFGRVVTDPQADLRSFDVVLVSLTETVGSDWARALSRAMLAGCKVRHVGEYIEELRGSVSLDHFEVDHLPPNGIASYRLIKRALDIGLVVFILPVVLPILAAGMLAVLVTSGRPALFVQERVGLGGKTFRMYKLRTMRTEAPGGVQRAAAVGDARVTRAGRLLRRLRVDELPQLWNVLKGDMSLIGPRPEQPGLTAEYIRELPAFAYRHLVRPGITGWAQVRAGYAANLEETRTKLTFDLYYVKKLSLYLDLQIVFRTLWTISSGSGVR